MPDGGGKHFCITIVFNLLKYNFTVNIHIKSPQEAGNVHVIKCILFIITCLPEISAFGTTTCIVLIRLRFKITRN